MRTSPSVATIKRLFAASGGRCSFPGCTVELLHDRGTIAEISHISAASPGGPRYDSSLSDDQRRSCENLIILCPTHHALIDERPDLFGIQSLVEMKKAHEARVHGLLSMPAAEPPMPLADVAATQLARQVDSSVADFAIIVALEKELEALLRFFPTLEKVVLSPQSRTYYRGLVVAEDGFTTYRVIATLLQSMGNLQSATATTEIIREWNPRYVVMCGIAGGLRRGFQQLGDVVVGTSVVYYEMSKVLEAGTQIRPVTYPADSLMIDRALHLHQGSAWRARLPARPDSVQSGPSFPAVHFGALASGEKVIASAEEATRLLDLDPRMCAVEMEAGGVATSAFAVANRVGFFVVRSICDFADRQKDDSWQYFAAYAAASFLREVIGSRPIAPAEGEWSPRISTAQRSQDAVDPKWVRNVLFPRLNESLDMESFRDLCFVLQVDVDNLEGGTKRAKIRELLKRAERRGRMAEIQQAYQRLIEEDW